MTTKNNVVKMPNSKQVEFGDLNLQLRLDGKSILNIEKRLDESLMGLFINGNGGMRLPATNKLLIVLQGANQTSNVGDIDIVRAFDKYIDEGHTTLELFTTIQELLEDSGFFGKEKTEEISGVSLDNDPIQEDSIL